MEDQFLYLARKFEEKKKELEEVSDQLSNVMEQIGVGQYVQDPITNAVYKIITPEGTYVTFRKISYKRTALEGERGGTVLSKKEAEEAGFNLNK
jgi:hypothetical protein